MKQITVNCAAAEVAVQHGLRVLLGTDQVSCFYGKYYVGTEVMGALPEGEYTVYHQLPDEMWDTGIIAAALGLVHNGFEWVDIHGLCKSCHADASIFNKRYWAWDDLIQIRFIVSLSAGYSRFETEYSSIFSFDKYIGLIVKDLAKKLSNNESTEKI